MVTSARDDTSRSPVVSPSKPRLLKVLGPGLITGASDDDPSGIATYSQAGAQFGYGLTWTMLFTYPLMPAVQEISARIGRASGRGIAGNLRRHYPNWLLQSVVALLLIANNALGEARKWPVGMARAPQEATAFYVTVSIATLIGVILNFAGIDPIKALFWTAVINGVVAVPVMVCMMLMASHRKVMGPVVVSAPLRIVGWLATAAMAAGVAAMMLTLVS